MVTRLLEGHERFRREYFEHERELMSSLSRGAQSPTAMVISCSDSRVVPNLILQADPGDLFVVRNIANIVPRFDGELLNRSVAAAIEYAIGVLSVRHLVVCGHTQCGGIRAIADGPENLSTDLPTLAMWLNDARGVRERIRPGFAGDLLRQLVFENVVVQLENLLTHPIVARALEENRLEIHGWVYDLADGSLRGYDPSDNTFRPVGDEPR